MIILLDAEKIIWENLTAVHNETGKENVTLKVIILQQKYIAVFMLNV